MRICYPILIKSIVSGICAAQLIGFIMLYSSNTAFHEILIKVHDSGYFVVPCGYAKEALTFLSSAFFGAFFFTLTSGVTISLIGSVCGIFALFFSNHRKVFCLFMLFLFFCLYNINEQKISFIISCFFIFPGAVSYYIALRLSREKSLHFKKSREYRNFIYLFVTFVVILFTVSISIKDSFFIDFRDNLFLSNPVGQKINSFYYKYTLYPAYVFKSLEQKQFRTFDQESIKFFPDSGKIKQRLINNYYFPIEKKLNPDLKLELYESRLGLFDRSGTLIIVTNLYEFVNSTSSILKKFSKKTDNLKFFRQFTYFSLIGSVVIILFLLIYLLVYCIFQYYQIDRMGVIASGIVCLILFFSLILYFDDNIGKNLSNDKLYDLLFLKGENSSITALKYIAKEKKEIAEFPYEKLLVSSNIVLRYWLVYTLGFSKCEKTYHDLITLLDDSHDNIVCMVLASLRKRGQFRSVNCILHKICFYKSWYVQWYGYQTLKKTGWKQTERTD